MRILPVLMLVSLSGMLVSLLGMISCLPGISRQSKERDLQRRIDATSYTPYHPRKGKYRR